MLLGSFSIVRPRVGPPWRVCQKRSSRQFKRLAMEADERAYNNMTAPLSNGVGTANINTQSR
jgi:hypothetical protein